MSVFFLLLTVFIAVLANFGEILSKNESKNIRDIANPYLFMYLAINGFFAGVVYYFLPDVAKFVLKPEYASWASGDTWGRVAISAFGYAVIVRAKFITIRDTPLGIDTLYDFFAQYCLRHTNMRIIIRQDKMLGAVYAKYNELNRYSVTLDYWIDKAPSTEREELRLQKTTIMASTLSDNIKCKRLGELILRIVGTQIELERVLANAVFT